MLPRPLALVVCLALMRLAVAQPAPRDLLRASAPGAYAVRYLPDRALISSSSRDACELRVHLPQQPVWGYLGKDRQPAAFLEWDATDAALVLHLQPGAWGAEVGWAGTGERPQQGQTIPLSVDGERVGDLTASFTLDAMAAQGGAQLPEGIARIWLDAAAVPAGMALTARAGGESVSEWLPVDGRLQGRGQVALAGAASVEVRATGYNLLHSPVGGINLELLARPVDVVRVDGVPAEGLLVEAEDFTGEGDGTATISVGEHADEHGGRSIYNFGTGTHWLEWTLEVPQDGEYALFARIANADAPALREVTVDGRTPAKGYQMVRFPVTGGWAHAAGEWWFVQVAGGRADLPALDLTKGKHILRLRSIGGTHLNLDYLVLKPA